MSWQLQARRRSAARLLLLGLALAATSAGFAPASAAAASTEPVFIFSPAPDPGPPVTLIPPPTGFLNDPCGIAVDSAGNFYISDYNHDRIDVYDGSADYAHPAPAFGDRGYLGQMRADDALDGPCGMAFGNGGELYVNSYHRSVQEFGPSPGFAPGPVLTGAGVDSAHPTGVAVDSGSGRVYVDERTYIGVYEPSGAPVEEAGQPLRLGLGSLGEGYGIAVSTFPGTAGDLYVADAASDTVKVYDPAVSQTDPIEEIDGSATPPGEFVSLRDASLAVDRVTGEVYLTDDLQPELTESPHGLVDVFDAAGAYEGHLKYEIVIGRPSGLAVDNSAGPNQGRVYVTSGNTHLGAIYGYPPGAATTAPPLPGSVPPRPPSGDVLFPALSIGGATAAGAGLQIACEGDACQILPPEPLDPPLSTLASGLGNPRVRYRRYARARHRRNHHQRRRNRRGHGHGHRARAAASLVPSATPAAAASAGAGSPAPAVAPSSVTPPSAAPPRAAISRSAVSRTAVLPPLPSGFDAKVWGEGGAPDTLAGSHPYALKLGFGLQQGGGEAGLRRLRFDLPPDMLLDPAATTVCPAASFASPRSSPYETSVSGEDCSAASQLGTLEAEDGAGEVRRFGLFQLQPSDGSAAELGAAPFGVPLLFDVHLLEDGEGSLHLVLESSQLPQSPALHGLTLLLWGAPWDASHDGERGNCLDEAEPSFPWAKCSVVAEPPASSEPLAQLTLPTVCGAPLDFEAHAESWSGSAFSGEASGDPSGQQTPVEGCQELHFEPSAQGTLSTKHVSSPSGFVFRLGQEDSGFVDPRQRAEPRARSAVVQLPPGVTLNPSLGAGLEGCTPAQLVAESLAVQGCPNGSKIGDFSLGLPFYKGTLQGAIYLAQPFDNPYNSLLAVYLVAKAADRGILVKARGKLTPNPGDGTITASFDGLTQLPYNELKLEFRAGQRAALVSPSSCGPAPTRSELTSWTGSTARPPENESPLEAGIEGAVCPTGTPPFHPTASAGGVNSNANSYTPYFIHLSRTDSEQEITSYSLVLPKGITGKLAGIPFCPDAAIAAARAARGFDEAAHPSCPAASQVGHTLSGYGVGPALAYSEGGLYLAGPYHGAPLSLVTINPATVGPFDLGTIVVRSAFDLDPRTAQLQIDSRGSDPIPHIIDGVVLHLRDIRVFLDRSAFTHNPSSCEPSELVSTLTGSGASFENPADDSTATASERFQLLNCRNLGFHPKLGLRLLGSSRRGGFPALRATFAARGSGDSNLKEIGVDLPHQLFLAQEHIRAVCSQVQFDAEHCPPGSVYGKAVAYTPLLDQPLRGNVYLGNSDNKLPDLVADLHSGSIRIVLDGRIGPTKSGGVRAFFADLPDAPITRFTMLMQGGRQGLFVNSVDVCRRSPLASVRALGQNNTGAVFTSLLRGQCNAKKKRQEKR